MKLTFEQLQAAALGTAYLSQEQDAVRFHRFTPAQEAVYAQQGHPMPLKACASAGIVLSFRTDSSVLTLRGRFDEAWSRDYCGLDVAVDGKYLASVDNFSHLQLPEGDYTEIRCTRDCFAKTFDLGAGKKIVRIYLPWSAACLLEAVELADGSSFAPVRPEKKILFFGDSITQGYDALRPMNRYAARVADVLGMEEYNKAIGGECFCPELAQAAEALSPEILVVAYGTNNWGLRERSALLNDAPVMLRTLRQKYPAAAFYLLLPIWRGDQQPERDYGSFSQMRQDLRQIGEAMDGITVIDCYDFVPHEPRWFGDLRLHPNDAGFGQYAANLLRAMG